MSTTLKRKTSPGLDATGEEPSKRRFVEASDAASDGQSELEPKEEVSSAPEASQETGSSSGTPAADSLSAKAMERQERFKALQARQAQSRKQNMKDSTAESQRLSTDPKLLSTLHRKHAIASHKLLKADTEEAGEDFERKRAWDWTIEESEKWDKRMSKKEKHRDNSGFQDYRQEARKAYKRQMREFKPDMEGYEKQKTDAVQRAAQNGGLEIVETEDGELIAVDKDGTFYSTADSTDFVHNKPEKAAIDRLVNDIRKAEEARMKKRRERAMEEDDGDVTYINAKNKQFNQKLARFYNKYTADIRDSFERGTAI